MSLDNNRMKQEQLNQFVVDLLSIFSNISKDDYEQSLNQFLIKVGKFFSMDKTYIATYFFDDKKIKYLAVWPKVNKKLLDVEQSLDLLDPSMIHKHQQGKTVFIEKEHKSTNLLLEKNESMLTIPIMNHQACLGFLGLVSAQSDKVLNDQEINSLVILTKSLSSFIFSEQIEIDLIKMKKQTEEAYQTKTQFLSNISHEIKTPLSGVYNAIYLLGSTELNQEQKDYIELGQASLDALANIVEDVLDITKIEAGKMEVHQDTFNLEEELIRVLRMQKSFATDKGIELIFKFDNLINYELIGDFRKIRQILLNLINNAIKYTNKGTVSLEVKLVEHGDTIKIRFNIIDTGIGIDKQHIKHIFDAFYQVDQASTRTYQGTGLGLSICHELTELLSGQLEIESEINKGSTFSVTIPLKKGKTFEFPLTSKISVLIVPKNNQKSHVNSIFSSMGMKTYLIETIENHKVDLIVFESNQITEQEMNIAKKNFGKEHVLKVSCSYTRDKNKKGFDLSLDLPMSRNTMYQRIINRMEQNLKPAERYQDLLNAYALIVDDNRLNRIALENILKKIGITSKSVDSGLKAIEAVKQEKFDIILMDIQMPEMDGIEATRRIRNIGKSEHQVPIIAVTANAFLKDYDVMKTSQINDVIFKPIKVEALTQVLRKYIKATLQIEIPTDLFIFDQQDFEMRFEGSQDIAVEVIQTFFDEYPKDLVKIKESIESNDPNEIISTTHYFKGSCSYLSAKRAVWILNYMMDLAKNKRLDLMDKLFELLENEIKSLIFSIKEYLK